MQLPRMPRPLYIVYRILEMAVSLVSRAYNAIFLKGSTHQTTSARSYIEPLPKHQKVINALFFWQRNPHHCERAWNRDVERAQKTLERNKRKKR